jgi:hypothetical protein
MKVLSAVTITGAALFLGGNPITAATQAADNSATSKAPNAAKTWQGADQDQAAKSTSGNHGCGKYCAGGGGNLTPQDQSLDQKARTEQEAFSKAAAKQHNLNVNSPVSESQGKGKHDDKGKHHDDKGTSGHPGGSWGSWGGSSADQTGFNHAGSKASNSAYTGQGASQGQSARSSSGNSGCWKYCTGGGGNLTPQSQHLGQHANTAQWAGSVGKANQHNLNVNSPVAVGGKSKPKGGRSGGSADQLGFNDANSWAANKATTKQGAEQGQHASSNSGNSGCTSYCTGGGGNLTPQDQSLNQKAKTEQGAESIGVANQQLLNVNIPITIVGWGSVGSAGGSATQIAFNDAASKASNNATTKQGASQGQQASSNSGNSGCTAYCTGGGGNLTPQSQSLGQHAGTSQGASSQGIANQGASNTSSPVAIG